MKKLITVLIVLLLLFIAVMQFLSARGVFPKQKIQTVCPLDAIKMVNGKAIVDAVKCNGCRRCVDGFLATVDPVTESDLLLDTLGVSAEDPIDAPAEDAPALPQTDSIQNTEADSAPKKTQQDSDELSLKDNPTSFGSDEESHEYYVVDSEACISCGLCINRCPESAIHYVDDKAFIDKDLCTYCGTCVGKNPDIFAGCPVAAIHPAGSCGFKPDHS